MTLPAGFPDPDDTQAEWAKKIAEAGAMTEAEMREAEVPTLDTIEQLGAYIQTLTDRPHDYGTCVYAMSMAAVAAFHFVARKLGVTGFQASCADMDILRRTRHWNWGKILDFEQLLYPQYCTEEHFPSWQSLLVEHKDQLAEMAAKKLAEIDYPVHPNVRAHWEMLARKEQQK